MTLLMTTVAGVVSWYPQEYADVLFGAKGVLGVIAVVLLIVHMNLIWHRTKSTGQRTRYLSLLGFAVLVAGGSAEQISEGQLVSYRHLGSTLVMIMLIISMLISLHEDRDDVPPQG